jgi:hypothetical protein
MVDKGLSFDLGPDAVKMGLHLSSLTLYDAHVKTTEIINSSSYGSITFFGDCSIDCSRTSTLNGQIEMSERYAYTIGDPSSQPNDTVVVLKNVNFQPSRIDYRFYPMKDKGYFKVDGNVDLARTHIKLAALSVEGLNDNLGKRILFIESTAPIKGQPTIESYQWFNGEGNEDAYYFSFEKEGNRAYLVVRKKTDDSKESKESTEDSEKSGAL